jgi:tRNA A-37 threonylcarbamoyl transferase component Bud32
LARHEQPRKKASTIFRGFADSIGRRVLSGGKLISGSKQISEDQKRTVLSFCRHIAGSAEIAAICVNSDYALGLSAAKTAIQVMVIIRRFQPRLMNYVKVFNSSNIVVSAVDKWVFERDVDRGFLGEALAGGLIFAYEPLINGDYLHTQELHLKKRLTRELLESLVLDFPELSYDFHIKPEYFVHQIMLTRTRLFPPIVYSMRGLVAKNGDKRNVEQALKVFLEALHELQTEGIISLSDGYIRMSKEFVSAARAQKTRFTSILRTGQRALFMSILSIFPRIMSILSQNMENLLRLQKPTRSLRNPQRMVDPENYVFVHTASGLAPLANKMDVEAFARDVLHSDDNACIKIETIGGFLNDVYLVKTVADGQEKKAVVKRFRDWSSFKWFPLTLWSVGTRSFTVLGSSRLEKELAINQLLNSEGFAVPKILHVSHNRRLIFMEYVEGETLSRLIKKVASSKIISEVERCLDVITRVGALFANVHSLNIALGDTKPENVLLGNAGEIYLMDFEQASRNGDKVWDIAEFLYYGGHDVSPLVDTVKVEQIAKAFIEGYLKAGGNVKHVKEVANPKYTKVFSVFTFPHIIFIIANVCRKAETLT